MNRQNSTSKQLKIILSDKVVGLDSWNFSYGNKILHLLFAYALAETYGLEVSTPQKSVLDDIFNLPLADAQDISNCELVYDEPIGYEIENNVLRQIRKYLPRKLASILLGETTEKALKNSHRQYISNKTFIDSASQYSVPITFIGHNWHYGLMPTYNVFDVHKLIPDDSIRDYRLHYPDIDAPNHVAVHLRDTDYQDHLPHIFPNSIRLPDSYYYLAIERVEQELGSDVVYHLFSDNHDRIVTIFQDKNYVLHQGSAPQDWLGLYLSNNIIQSNSSFCWSASFRSKQFSIQPVGGLNYNSGKKTVSSYPYGFMMSNSIGIKATES